MLVIKPVARVARDEELAAVGARPTVGHREQPWRRVLELKILVVEFVAVDACAASAVTAHKVAALHHEALDHTVEARALEADGLAILAELTRAELPKVFGRARHDVSEELDLDAARAVAAYRHVEEDDRVAVREAWDATHT